MPMNKMRIKMKLINVLSNNMPVHLNINITPNKNLSTDIWVSYYNSYLEL